VSPILIRAEGLAPAKLFPALLCGWILKSRFASFTPEPERAGHLSFAVGMLRNSE